MKIKEDITSDNYKKKSKKFLVLSNPIHLRILLLLENKKMTHDQIHEILKKEAMYKHRENTHHALDKLVNQKLIKKEYDQNKKKIFYFK